MLKRATYSISINKLVAEGNCLEKGEELYCYLAEDTDERPIVVIYLDGKKRGEESMDLAIKKLRGSSRNLERISNDTMIYKPGITPPTF